jgi:hypothetical protein
MKYFTTFKQLYVEKRLFMRQLIWEQKKSMVWESGSGQKCGLLDSEVHTKPNQKTILDRMVEWDSLYLGVTQNPDWSCFPKYSFLHTQLISAWCIKSRISRLKGTRASKIYS